MRPEERVITATPMRELWDERGPVPARRSRELSASDLRDLLRQGPVRFVIADVGCRPRWLPLERCFTFWKDEVQPHLTNPNASVYREDFPGGYYYSASEWDAEAGPRIILLETWH